MRPSLRRAAGAGLMVIAALTPACPGGHPAAVAPASGSAACIVMQISEMNGDPRTRCVVEMVYAALVRTGYQAYKARDHVWTEHDPAVDLTVGVRVEEDHRTEKLRADLILADPYPTSGSRVESHTLLDPERTPTDAAVAGLISTALGSAEFTAYMQGRHRQCRGPMLPEPEPLEPNVSEVCAGFPGHGQAKRSP